MPVNWNMGIMPDIGGNALAAFERGQQQGQQRKAQEAMATYATNPDDPNALNALAQYDPKFVMSQKQALAEKAKTEQDTQRKALLEGAQKIGEAALWADTPEKWDQAVDYLSQYYPAIAQQKGKFTPEARMAAIASAGEMKTKLEQEKGVNVGPGSHLVDPVTGKAKFSAPFAPRPVTLSPGQTAFEYDPNAAKGDPASIWQNMLRTESGGQHFRKDGSVITSPAGAIGIAQVMPGTAPEAARLAGVAFDEQRYRNDPAYNEALGQAYFQEQLRTFGDPEKAVAAYNAGPGNVQKAVAKGGENWKQFLPGETKGYLQSVFGGGSRVIGRGASKEQWQTMTPQEAQAMGLPAGTVYQRGPTGEVKAVGGQQAGGGLSKQQIGAAKTKISSLAAIKAQIARVRNAEKALNSGGFEGPVWGRIPGAGAMDSESATYDKAVAQLAPLIRQLTRTPGEGAMSDYESKLASLALPSRTDNRAARNEAMQGMEELLTNLEAGYSELLAPNTAPSPSAPQGKKPTVSNW